MLKCREVVDKADALVDRTPLPWRERLALHLHLFICSHCRRYVRQLRALTQSMNRDDAPLSDEQTRATLNALNLHDENTTK